MKTLDECRAQINELDNQIASALAMRMSLSKEIGEVKRAGGLPITDEKREKQVLARVGEIAEKTVCGTSNRVRAVYELILDESKKMQR